ncbi:MAG: hypothetical protein IPK68_01705 [Bdellovibrionales bacterium]|nr:hypothetical protein [Bdellovibrionales bacterium]
MLNLAGTFVLLVIFFHNCGGSNFEARKVADELGLSGVADPFSKDELGVTAVQNAFPIPFGGNGHSTTWDGRLLVYTPEAGGSWNVVVFRPERVQGQQGISVNLGSLGGTGALAIELAC